MKRIKPFEMGSAIVSIVMPSKARVVHVDFNMNDRVILWAEVDDKDAPDPGEKPNRRHFHLVTAGTDITDMKYVGSCRNGYTINHVYESKEAP